ncbi:MULTISPECIES: hypothetical protein [Actinoalloteichus]|uniref:Uncharacterized protein n=1 Tax=Actinoalloteichus fjordicus TaxID=1612552 RepID=A0AAC9PUQ4_9PSEU|nr:MULTISPECIES: hypothetical protein [Actinoalloteichus]APU17196.1 hypothetical protein UA74_25955 [Actinoalloteichus fjordicus]APU23279.1 hypothetical protein UA75_26540 [Actinoalloteichus sp. GBA129-24]
MWHGYVEKHALTDSGRKRDGVDARRAREPQVVLNSPEEVSDWISRTRIMLAKDADPAAQAKNALMLSDQKTYLSAARKGGSVYSSVQATQTETWDICAEAAP